MAAAAINLTAAFEFDRFSSSFGIASGLPQRPSALAAAAFSAHVLSSVEAASSSLNVCGIAILRQQIQRLHPSGYRAALEYLLGGEHADVERTEQRARRRLGADDRHFLGIVTQPIGAMQGALHSAVGGHLLAGNHVFNETAAGFVAHIPQRFRGGKTDFTRRIVERGLERRERLAGFHFAQLRRRGGANQRIVIVLQRRFHQPNRFRIKADGSCSRHGLPPVQRIRIDQAGLQHIPGGLVRLRQQAAAARSVRR